MPRIMIILLVLTASACTPHGRAPAPSRLSGGEWLLEDLSGAGVIDNAEATLGFLDSGRVAGRASCNRFTGAVAVRGDSISFGPLAATKMACLPAVSDQETKYLAALGSTTRYAFDADHLLIFSRGADKPLRFSRRAAAAGKP